MLKSWAVPKGPCLDPAIKRLAIHVEDHPLSYGSFEGVIPKGHYGAGSVLIWDKGKWKSEDKNPKKAYASGHMTFSLKGKKLSGKWKLIRINEDDKTWLLMKLDDEYAKSLRKFDVLENESLPVLTDKLKMKSSTFPSSISPQLATLVESPPAGKDWLHEVKLDGYRIIAFKKNNTTRLLTRNKNDWTGKFPLMVKAINQLPIKNLVLDGEIVVLDRKNRPDFQLLQNAINESDVNDCCYYIFDILYQDKFNLMQLPLIERKKILKNLAVLFDGIQLRYNDHIAGSGKSVFKNACKLGMEGIISKQAESSYEQKRTRSWLKIKCLKDQEFVIED